MSQDLPLIGFVVRGLYVNRQIGYNMEQLSDSRSLAMMLSNKKGESRWHE